MKSSQAAQTQCVLTPLATQKGGYGIIKGMRKLPCWNFGVATIMSWMQEDYDVGNFVEIAWYCMSFCVIEFSGL